MPLGELVRVDSTIGERRIYYKNLMPLVQVTGDVGGQFESPVYAILNLGEALDQLPLPEGYYLEQHTPRQPFLADSYSLK